MTPEELTVAGRRSHHPARLSPLLGQRCSASAPDSAGPRAGRVPARGQTARWPGVGGKLRW